MTLPPQFDRSTEAGRKAQEKWNKEEQIRRDTGTTFYERNRKFMEEQQKNSANAPISGLVGQTRPAIGPNIMDRAPVGQVQEIIEGDGTLYTFGGGGFNTRADAEAARQKALNARSKSVAKQQGWLTQPNQSGGQSDVSILPYNVQNTPYRPGQPTIQTGQNIIPKSTTTTTTNTSAPTNSVPDLFSRIPGTPENIKRANPDAVGSGTPQVGFDPIITEVFEGNEGPLWLVKNPFTGERLGQFSNKNEAIQVAERSGGLNMTGNSGASSGVAGDGSYPGGPTYIIPGYDPTQFEGGSEQIRRAEAEGRLGIPALPPVPEMRLAPEMEARQEKELLSEKGLQVGEQSALQAAQARSDTGAIATRPSDTRPELSVATSTAVEDITSLDPSQIIGGPSAIVQAAQGTLDNKLAIAATREMDEKATVRYQLGELGKTIKDGQPLPAWASGAARAADAFALKRGLGASSMAVHARTLALQESGIDIAKADAESYRRLQELNLSNAQQTVITNANNLAALEKENLDSRLSASVDNARNALSIDLGNLTSRQRASELSFQQYTQKLFTDAAAVNAASQFNAKSKNDVDSFFASLDQSTANMNANRVEAIERDNAKQKNSMTEFYEAQKLSRDTFNVNTMANIRAANTKWYQSIATIQNSNQMLANSYAAQSELGLRSTEYNALWQKRRDDAQMLYDSTERDLDRVAQVAAQSAAMAQQAALARSSQKASKTSAIFSTLGTIAGAMIMAPCWVAREVYGRDAPEVYRFRWWLEREAPKWFNRLYKKRGEKFAYFIKDKPILKKLIKVWMDTKVKRVEKTWRLNRLNPA